MDEHVITPLFLRIFLMPDGTYKRVEDQYGNLVINVKGYEVLKQVIRYRDESGEVKEKYTGKIAGIQILLDDTMDALTAPKGTRVLTHDELTFTANGDPSATIEYVLERENMAFA